MALLLSAACTTVTNNKLLELQVEKNVKLKVEKQVEPNRNIVAEAKAISKIEDKFEKQNKKSIEVDIRNSSERQNYSISASSVGGSR